MTYVCICNPPPLSPSLSPYQKEKISLGARLSPGPSDSDKYSSSNMFQP